MSEEKSPQSLKPATETPSPGVRKLAPMGITIQAMQELVQLGLDNPKMPEGIFVDFLRAVFDPVTKNFNMSLWYKTFGSYRQGVDIIDASGNTVRVCPPPVGTVQTIIASRKVDSYSQVVENASLADQRHASLKEKVLKEGIEKHDRPTAHPVVEQWRAILLHYGILKAEDETQTNQPSRVDYLADEGDAL